MKYYKLTMDMERENDVICYDKRDIKVSQNIFVVGKKYVEKDDKFEFYYDKQEGKILTDYLANDRGWFIVSEKLKNILETINTKIQYIPVFIEEKEDGEIQEKYYIANIIRVVNALCLEKSDYFATEIPGKGVIYTVSKYGIYADKVEESDVFKLAEQIIPIFVSEKFKKTIENNKITGIYLREIQVA